MSVQPRSKPKQFTLSCFKSFNHRPSYVCPPYLGIGGGRSQLLYYGRGGFIVYYNRGFFLNSDPIVYYEWLLCTEY